MDLKSSNLLRWGGGCTNLETKRIIWKKMLQMKKCHKRLIRKKTYCLLDQLKDVCYLEHCDLFIFLERDRTTIKHLFFINI